MVSEDGRSHGPSMATEASPAASSRPSATTGEPADKIFLYPALKFILSNLKSLVPHHLSPNNYPVWRNQIFKLFKANGFSQFLDPPSDSVSSSADQDLPDFDPKSPKWIITDQNLAAALCSTISASVIPFVMHLESAHEIWKALQTRFQSSNRSKVIQLKNELHNISMRNLSMQEYLTDIKKIVDQITSTGSTLDTKDIIIYILNGLPPPYQSFKTSIWHLQSPLTLDNFYAMLITEELHLRVDTQCLSAQPDNNTALYTTRGRGRRRRGRTQSFTTPPRTASKSSLTCQICTKRGHSADVCWHRHNANYITPSPQATTGQALLASSDTTSTDWYLDSGATSHMTYGSDNLNSASSYQGSDEITVGDGRTVLIAHSGTRILPTSDRTLSLSNLLHIPSISYNLISISKLVRDNNISITFDPNGFVCKDLQTHKTLLQGPCKEGLYQVSLKNQDSANQALSAVYTTSPNWHERLGHPHRSILTTISHNNPSLHIKFHSSNCSSCNSYKSHKLVFPTSVHKTCTPLALLHSDVWGPSLAPSHQGLRYYLLIIDDYSRFSWIFPFTFKSDVSKIFINFITFIERQTSRNVQAIRTDGGREYVNHELDNFLTHKGIQHQLSCPYTPEQNGLAERKHRHIIETARTMLHTASMPITYWSDAVVTAVYLINRMPTPTTNHVSTVQLMFQNKPDYSHLRTFGCECFPLLPSHSHTKLQPNSVPCTFLGYADNHKGYRCLNNSNNNIIISRNVKFVETSFPFKLQHPPSPTVSPALLASMLLPLTAPSKPRAPTVSPIQQPTNPIVTRSPPAVPINQPPPTASTSASPPQIMARHPMTTRSQTSTLKPIRRLNLLHSESTSTDPTSNTEANKSFEWRQAMAAEFFALQK
ncbi:hypothetical protein KFK09_011347 [Dendrobium nobile]|uniref:Integrase catalytic domain-containing protein n=1 Tax=Dendrobium nobile TaxID=94219 RepID=A0A8T3BI06_DENNO|nr:hypothetical protein KFK09_011347 [Dendrobium nobile]